MPKNITRLLILTIALLFTACSAAGADLYETTDYQAMDDSGGGFAFAEEPAAAAAESRDFDVEMEESIGNTGDVKRLVIKNGDLSISVDDPVVTMDEVMAMAEEMGGFVVSSSLYYRTLESGEEVPQANVVIRVPSDRFDEAMSRIKTGVGQVLNESVSGQDVTQEYTDLSSRLVNLEAAEEELQRIMEEARDTEDVLNVYNQLINIREQIEVIKGRMQYFEQSAAFSAINATILADEAVQPLSIGGWQPVGVAKDAIQALINTLKVIANLVIWLVLWGIPVVLVLWLVLYLPFRLLRKGFRKVFPKKKKAAPKKPSETEE